LIFNNLNVFYNFLNFDWFSGFHVVHDGFGIWIIGVENVTSLEEYNMMTWVYEAQANNRGEGVLGSGCKLQRVIFNGCLG
jgi:hypothetical protein